jgi:TATA-binding protein-associated factor
MFFPPPDVAAGYWASLLFYPASWDFPRSTSTNFSFSSLQRFKLDVASTVVNQQNAGLATMETDQILDLFNVGETVAVTKQSEEEMVDVTTGEVKQKGAKGVLDDIGELWDESQYTDEYDLGNFIASLRE